MIPVQKTSNIKSCCAKVDFKQGWMYKSMETKNTTLPTGKRNTRLPLHAVHIHCKLDYLNTPIWGHAHYTGICFGIIGRSLEQRIKGTALT